MKIIGYSGIDGSVRFKREEMPGLDERTYRIAQGFDAAAVLLSDDVVRAAAAEERFTRNKSTGDFPVRAMKSCLAAAAVKAGELDYVAHGFAYEPFAKYFSEDAFFKRQYDQLYAPACQLELFNEHFPEVDWSEKLVHVPHHQAHAASSFFLSGFDEALVVVSDGMGEVHSATVYRGHGGELEKLMTIPALHSLGVLYAVFTLYLGFKFNRDEYKVMGLAPFGNQRRYFKQVMDLISLKDDGGYAIGVFGENKTLEERETHGGVLDFLVERFGPVREPESELTQQHKDIAAALQAALQTTQLHLLRHFQQQTGLNNLCLAGGLALNCTANGVIKRSRIFDDMFVQPASGDDGAALGAALVVQRRHQPNLPAARMSLPMLGPDFSDEAIVNAIAADERVEEIGQKSFNALVDNVAERLTAGEIVAWFQGRMEFGPRALGNRSILADPRPEDMRRRVNMLIKKREGFRPFAPAVMAEEATRYFEIDEGDEAAFAHMLYVVKVRQEFRESLHAITHVDGSARIQTVTEADNSRFWTLLRAFGKRSGISMLLNTSFNVRSQPIVCTPEEAIDTFLDAGIDALVLGQHLLVVKRETT